MIEAVVDLDMFDVVPREDGMTGLFECVVRCCDCVYYVGDELVCDRFGDFPSAIGVWFAMPPIGFCSSGERKG